MTSSTLSPHTYMSHIGACSSDLGCAICNDNYVHGGPQSSHPAHCKPVEQSEALLTIKGHIESINNDWATICSLVAAKGDKIMARWKRSNSAKRDAILHEAFGNVQVKQWAYLRAFYTPPGTTNSIDSHRDALLLPYLSQRGLARDPSKLLVLLELRRQHAPWHWAWTDHQITRSGRQAGVLAMRFSDTVFSTGADDYGKPVEFDHDLFHRWQQIGFPIAETLFEAQRNLYSRLSKMVSAILKGAEDTASGDTAWKAAAAEGFPALLPKAYNESGKFLHVPVTPFEPPPRTDVTELLTSISNRQVAAEEELWLLQTDIRSVYDRVAYIHNGKFLAHLEAHEKWAAIALELTQPLLRRVHFWATLRTCTDAWQLTMDHEIGPPKKLHKVSKAKNLLEGADLVLAFIRWLFPQVLRKEFQDVMMGILAQDCYFDHEFADIKNLFPAGPSDPACEVVCNPSGNGTVEYAPNEARKHLVIMQGLFYKTRQFSAVFERDPPVWAAVLFSNLTREMDVAIAEEVFPVMDELLVFPEENNVKLDLLKHSQLLHALKDFSVAVWLQKRLDFHAPEVPSLSDGEAHQYLNKPEWHQLLHRQTEMKAKNGTIGEWYRDWVFRSVPDEEVRKKLSKAGKLLEQFSKIKLPAEKRGLNYLTKSKEAKQALDAFWAEVREVRIDTVSANLSEYAGETYFTRAEVETLKDVRILDCYRDPGPLKIIEADIAARVAADAAKRSKRKVDEQQDLEILADRKHLQISPPKKPRFRRKAGNNDGDDGNDDDDDGDVGSSKKAPKRKHLPTPEEAAQPPPPIIAPRPPTPPPIRIPAAAKSIRIFARLWPAESRSAEEGAVTWNDLRAAMGDVGYPGVSIGGSCWSFHGPQGKVVLDTPHGTPHNRVERGKLMYCGRRLARAFGWNFGSFVEREGGN